MTADFTELMAVCNDAELDQIEAAMGQINTEKETLALLEHEFLGLIENLKQTHGVA